MPLLDIASIHSAYKNNTLSPETLCAEIKKKIDAEKDYNAWIYVLNNNEISTYLDRLKQHSIDELPLYGVPFAIKDNIDLAGIPTTAACAEYSYIPKESATAVQLLLDAGAIPIGKTNLDQFATGLVGTRSPYGAVKNAFNPSIISGGSSSGSAVSVALGTVSFSLGTDTAGSGRVPAALNNLFGLKPSKGRVSTYGVVPACRSLDCVSIFALNPDDIQSIFNIIDSYDSKDEYARKKQPNVLSDIKSPTIGIPDEKSLIFFNNDYKLAFKEYVTKLKQRGYAVEGIDFTPFKKAAELLYSGPWLAERYAAIEQFLDNQAKDIFPVTREIISPAKDINAIDSFKSFYKLQHLKRQADLELDKVDLILTPTIATHYSIEEVNNDPIKTNSNLGYYTNFMNLLDYAAIAIPTGLARDSIPFGVTLFSWAYSDQSLIDIAASLTNNKFTMGITDSVWQLNETQTDNINEFIQVAVCGAHLSDMPLNHQLTSKSASLIAKTKTSASYRFYALKGGPPYRPGLVRDEELGKCIEVEVWSLPVSRFGEFMQGIPAPLGIGKIELDDGNWVNGFICEPYGLKGAKEITEHGSWRKFIEKL